MSDEFISAADVTDADFEDYRDGRLIPWRVDAATGMQWYRRTSNAIYGVAEAVVDTEDFDNDNDDDDC